MIGVQQKINLVIHYNVVDIFLIGKIKYINKFFFDILNINSFSGQIEEYLHEEDALMDFLKHQASYCDVIKYKNKVYLKIFTTFFNK